jgi:hypothetical protein
MYVNFFSFPNIFTFFVPAVDLLALKKLFKAGKLYSFPS